MSGSRDKLRAVFLAFVMVMSVFGATVAFSGSAAADAGNIQVQINDADGDPQDATSEALVAGSGEVVVTGDVGTNGNDLVIAYDSDDNDEITQDDVVAVVEDDSTADEDGTAGTVQATVNLTDAPNIDVGDSVSDSNDGNFVVVEDTNPNGQLDTGSIADGGVSDFPVDTTNLDSGQRATIPLADAISIPDGGGTFISGNGAGALSSLDFSSDKERILITPDSGASDGRYNDIDAGITNTGLSIEGVGGQPTIDEDETDSDAVFNFENDGGSLTIENLELVTANNERAIHNDAGGGEDTSLTVRDSRIVINADTSATFGIQLAGQGADKDSLTVENTVFTSGDGTNDNEFGIRVGAGDKDSAGTQGTVDIQDSEFTDLSSGLLVTGGQNHNIQNNQFDQIDGRAVTFDATGSEKIGTGSGISVSQNTFTSINEDGVLIQDNGGEIETDFAINENNFNSVAQSGNSGDFAIAVGTDPAGSGLLFSGDDDDGNGGTDRVVDASNNFYGDSSGPSGQGPGTGAAVDQEVAFRPFFTDQTKTTLSSVNGIIDSSQGQAQNSQLVVTFSESVYDDDESDDDNPGELATGDLDVDDFSFNDASNGGISISSVSHSAGDSQATISLTGSATSQDTIAATAADNDGTEANNDDDGVFNGGGQAISTQSVSAAAAVGPSDGDVRVSIGGQASQSLRAGSSAQALDLLRVTDVSGTASLASDTVLSMPDGVTINESETSLSASTTGGLTANANVSDENTITIDHGDTASSTDETMRVSGIVVDVAPDVSASEGGTANDITVNYAIGSIDAGILSGEKPQLRTTGTEIVSAGGSGQDLADSITQLTVSTSNVDGQIANQTNININANQSNGITFDTDIDPTTLTASTTGNAEVDMSSASITQTELTVPVTSHFDAGDSVTIDVTSGDQLLIDAAGDASDSKLSATVVANASTGTVTAESSDQNVDVNVQKPVVDIAGGGDGGVEGNLVIGAAATDTAQNFLDVSTNNFIQVGFNTDSPLSSNSDITILTNRTDVSFDSTIDNTQKDAGGPINGDDILDAEFTSTAGSESVNSITVNDNSIVLDITNADQVASGSVLRIDNLPMVVDSSVEDEAALNFTAETTPSSGTTVTASSDPDGDFIELDKPDTTFNAGSNATIDVDTDGETGVEVNGGGTNALTIDSDDIDGQVGQGTTVRVELDGDGVTFDGSVNYQTGQADNSITNVQTSGGSPNVVNNDDVTRVNPTALEIDLEDSGTSLGGQTLTIDELFVNLTASATDTQLRVTTTTTSDTDVTSTAQEIIEPNTIDPSNVFADANINEDPAADDIGPDADNNNGGDYGGTASGEATDDSTTGDNPTTGETIFSSVYTSSQSDGSTAFGGADVSLEVVDTPDGGSDASLNTTSTSTDSSGVADFEFTAGSSTGTYIVNASTSAGSVNVTYEVTAGQASQVNVTNVDNALVQSGATTTEQEVSALRVRLEDSGGNIVTGTDFSFTVDLSGDAQLSTRNPNNVADQGPGGYDGIATDIDNNGEPADNAYVADADGGFTYQAGQDNTDEGVFFIFITDATTEDVTLTVTPDSANAGVNAISADTGTTTFFDQPTQTDVTLNESTISVDDETTAEAVAQTSSGTTIEVPRLNVGSITSNNTTVATVSNTDGSTNDAGVANATVTAEQNGTASIDATVAGNDGSATITVEEDAPAYYTLKLSNSIADRDVHAAIISIFSTHRQSGSTALLPHSVYRYTRTHTGGQR